MRLKVELYILSLWVLFLLLFINKATVPMCFEANCQFIGFKALIITNWIPVFCVLGMLAGCISFWRFKHRILTASKGAPGTITAVEHISFENLSFLATYIIPLLCFDLDFHLDEGRNAIMLILVLVAIGAIYIKADLYYTNPSLALMNFKIYRIEYTTAGAEAGKLITHKVVALSRDRLKVGAVIVTKSIGDEGDVELVRIK